MKKAIPLRKALWLIGSLSLTFALGKLAPVIVFEPELVGYDMNWETSGGATIAWGPRPRKWLLLADPERSLFSGSEWYYRVFRTHCNTWLQERKMQRPPTLN